MHEMLNRPAAGIDKRFTIPLHRNGMEADEPPSIGSKGNDFFFALLLVLYGLSVFPLSSESKRERYKARQSGFLSDSN
jgi:hypothetical protein